MEANSRVIVVDDEEGIVQAYLDILNPEPVSTAKKSSRTTGKTAAERAQALAATYTLFSAASGEAAVELVRREFQAGRRIACGFFDVKMGGGIDGLQAIQEIWKIDPDVHCTVVTAYHDRNVNDIDQLFGPRFKDQWDYLNKPFTQAEIIQKARQMVAQWNRKRNLEEAIAQLQTTQQQLMKSERMATIGQLARAVGHEFGNLLQAILGQAEVALSQDDPERVRAKLQMIVRAAERASLITRNMLSFSKPSAEQTSTDVLAVIRETLLLIGHQLTQVSIKLVDRCTSVSPIQANAAELEQVLLNLIINAIHATPRGGTIEVGCRDEGKDIVIWVRDTGSGIPKEALARIFEYGFTTKGERGTGIGLSISKAIVENHRGRLEVKTEAAAGTTFTLKFPRRA